MLKRSLFSVMALGAFVGLATGSQVSDSSFEDDWDDWEELDGAEMPAPAALPSAGGTSLDAFFGGIEQGCSKNPTLSAALDSMGSPKRDYSGWTANPTITVPGNLQASFGAPHVSNTESDYSVLQVDITDASYLGFPVVGMSHWMGNANGINGFSFTLDAPLDKVQARVDSSLEIVDSCSIDTGCFAGPFEMTLSEASGNKTEITCDTSN